MKKYRPYVKKYWYSFLLGPLFMVLEACGEFLLPYINADVINVGAASGDVSYILRRGALMFVIACLMMLAGVLGANFAIRGASRLAAGVRGDVFRKIQTFSFSNIDDFTTGSLITRITNDI
ncbi:MAG: ABC transporter ATP-binding protein, partial [Clostridia bacterium]|nr:ABC transporter ATP-binding protein [Clostridia bacterium]